MTSSNLETELLEHCPLCGGSRHQLLEVPDFESGTGTYGVDACTACGVAFTNPRPLDRELWKLYASRGTADFAPRSAGLAAWLRGRLIQHRLKHALSPRPGQSLRLLDYGCGDGSLVAESASLARRNGFELEALGVDFHTEPPPTLTSTPGTAYLSMSEWEGADTSYDHIFVRHVLEHHSNPPQLLRMLAERLREGGSIHIEVPNRRSVWAQVFGAWFFPYYVPRHLFHFDAGSLRAVIERSGLHAVSIERGHTPAIGKSLGWWFSRPIDNLGVLGLATYPVQVAVDALARQSTTLLAKVRRA